MSALDIEALGFTREELQERVVERICERLLVDASCDEDGEPVESGSRFAKTLETRIRKHIELSIDAMAQKHILPNVTAFIERLTLQKTNEWGEARGGTVTFIEYLTQRAEAYMTEKVNFKGEKPDSYSPSTQTRIAHMVHEHLHYSISNAMKKALETANSAIVEGIHETVKLKLAEFAAALKVTVETKERRR